MLVNLKDKKEYHLTSFACIAMGIALSVYAYLGTFSRHLSDDYCESARVFSSSPLQAVIQRYQDETWPRPTVRYSNLFFVGVSESFGMGSMPITIFGSILLWAVGLTWCVHEIRKFFNISWYIQVDIFLGLMFAFFSLLEAPNLFQTIYWRSAMMTHFAPLVFGSFLFSFSLKLLRGLHQKKNSYFFYMILLFGSFIFAGFSEPPTTTALTALPIFIVMIWLWSKPQTRPRQILLLAVIFSGVLFGLITMLLSPAGANATQDSSPAALQILSDSFYYSYVFLLDSLKTLPLAIAISILLPFLLILLMPTIESPTIISADKRKMTILMFAILLLIWLLIAAGFAPSVYGQGYPVERARFIARVMMISACILEGILLGQMLKDIHFSKFQGAVQTITLILFGLLAIIYPLRAAWLNYSSNLTEYQERAMVWDLRNQYILRHASAGEENLIIPAFSGLYGIKELDQNPNHWVNICAARYYGVNSIEARTMQNEFMMEYLNE